MKHLIPTVCLLLAGALPAGHAVAQQPPALAQLSQCITSSADDADRVTLVRWLFAGLSAHPELRAMGNVDQAQRAVIDRDMGALMQRLIVDDCITHVRQLEPAQMQGAMQVAFQALGEQAGMAAMTHPDVLVANQGLLQHLDVAAFERAFSDGAASP